ncbi:MAG TPA: hypothetical protein P5081_00990 [Phycisphaerae bacterium]|nr:hypothetical protein [Phycisphaerae bacterium]HRW51428.1 hypothetical protein [Phycisphaerae bacterium]
MRTTLIQLARSAALVVAVGLMMGVECTRVPIGLPIQRVEFSQSGPCVDLEFPASIAITRLDDGAYSLDLSLFEVNADDSEDFSCLRAGGSNIDGVCYTPTTLTTRMLTPEETQRVDEVMAQLEEVTSFDPSRGESPCANEPCGSISTRVNEHVYSNDPCPPKWRHELTTESAGALRSLWLSFVE